jgi:diaminopimelate decarboxylase
MENSGAILELCKKYDSFYLYDEGVIRDSIASLRQAFGGAELLYSVKANPAPGVLRLIFSAGLGADAASLGEVLLAARMGVEPGMIQYSAPGKRPSDIEGALGKCTVIADSPGEVELIGRCAEKLGVTAEIGIRLNPDFTFTSDRGAPSKFGVDQALAFRLLEDWKRLPNVRIAGIHVHSRSQELRAEVLGRYYENMFGLACDFQDALGQSLEFVNMGSGLGIPYSAGDRPLDIPALGVRMAELTADFRERLPGTRIILETGRFVVGKSGVYVSRVLDRKESMGKTYIILQNTMNGFIRPSISRLVEGCSHGGEPAPAEPLYTGKGAFQFTALPGGGKLETVTLAGNLCTAQDIIADDISLPALYPGDAVVISNAGCYAAALSPMQFACHDAPAQLIIGPDGRAYDAMK